MPESLAIEVELAAPFAAALEAARLALKAEGFGILTEIDLRATFKEKLGHEFRPYVILGACNPPLAYSAVSSDAQVGLLLPCNVTVEAAPSGGSIIRLTNPETLLQAGSGAAAPSAAVWEVARDARARMTRVAAALRALPASRA